MVTLVLAFHNHQPVGNFDWVFEDSYRDAYLPLLEVLEAHPEIRFAQHYTGKGGPLSLRALAYATSGPTGYIIGAYGLALGGPDVGKFTLTLRMDGEGRWLIVSDMDNGNARR